MVAGGLTGLGYTYTAPAAAGLINGLLAEIVVGTDPMATASTWSGMVDAIRNLGRPGIVSSAIAAVDIALWDLKGRLLERSVADLLGRAHDSVMAYGSGGFTSLDDAELRAQLGGWAEQGLAAVKMKVGRDPANDPHRVQVARDAIGDAVGLFVDANGAYTAKQATAFAVQFVDAGVTWFEEPSAPTTSTASPRCGPLLHPGWRSPPASTATTCPTSVPCSTPGRSTASRPTSPAVPVSPGS